MNVAIVGAGVSGLACARGLAEAGAMVTVFEKSRGPGGRMATRRAEKHRFDHGAQYFTARDPRFKNELENWLNAGCAALWEGEIVVLRNGAIVPKDTEVPRFVGVPGMSAICGALSAGLEVRARTEVSTIEREGDSWSLRGASQGEDLGLYDAVVVSAPAPQAARLLAEAAPELAATAGAVEMSPCWAVMAAFEAPLETAFDAAFVHGSPLSWIARNDSKPRRPAAASWVLHASPEWSRKQLEISRQEAGERLLGAFWQAVGIESRVEVTHLAAHRWRFALPPEPLPESCLADPELRLAACGDWCAGPRVEGAFLSGVSAAAAVRHW